MRLVSRVAVVLLLCLFVARSASADVVTGSVSMWWSGHGFTVAGDGTNNATFAWSRQYFTNGFFYGFYGDGDGLWGTPDSDVAFAGCNIDVNTIDAASLGYTGTYIGVYGPGGSVDATGCFVAARNVNTGHYGLLRIDSFTIGPDPHIPNENDSAMNATWWFQTDGTGRFAASPEPSALVLLGCVMVPFVLGLRKR